MSLSFGKRKILDNVNFTVNQGQILGLLGPNGVGKSTIFNLITGLIKPDYGNIVINSKNVNDYPIYLRTTKFKIGYVPQYGGYFHDLTLLENLNAIGDGGFLTTNDKNIFNKAKTFSNHGLANRNLVKHFSFLSRMDVIQSAVLNFRLQNLKYIISARRKNAEFYLKNLNRARYFFKNEKPYEFNTYHTFVIQTKDRDKVANYLKKNNIGTAIHYPIPLHLQPAAKYLGYKKGDFPKTEKQSKEILTIPIHQYLTKKELRKVVDTLNKI